MDKIGCKKDYYTLAVRIQRRWFGCYWSIFTFTMEFKAYKSTSQCKCWVGVNRNIMKIKG